MQSEEAKELVLRGYDALSERYDEAFGSDTKYGEWLAELLTRLGGGSRVLDVGCGAGVPVAKVLADAGHVVTGVDISRVQIERATERVPHATFVQADATELEFPAESFDAVLTFYSLIHIPVDEQERLLQKIASWLRPGGVFVATVGASAWTGAEEGWLGGDVPMWWSSADADTTRRWIEAAGLVVERAEFVPEGDSGHTLIWASLRTSNN
jgi:ubiquinone/menaquinone biosynthesis C-methylase UbiE